MEWKRVVQYITVLLLTGTIVFIGLVAFMFKLAFSEVKEEQNTVQERDESVCECR